MGVKLKHLVLGGMTFLASHGLFAESFYPEIDPVEAVKVERIISEMDLYIKREKDGRFLTKGSNGRSGLNRIFGRLDDYVSTLEDYVADFEQFGYDYEDLKNLVLGLEFVESEGYARAVNPNSNCTGPYQFEEELATDYFDLEINDYVNETFDPVRTIGPALNHLAYLSKKFGSIDFGLAAYNWGPKNVERLAKKYGSFWEVPKNKLPPETWRYVAQIYAIVNILDSRNHRGVRIKPEKVNTIKYVVKRGDTLAMIANRFDTSVDEIMYNNILVDKNKLPSGHKLKIPSKS